MGRLQERGQRARSAATIWRTGVSKGAQVHPFIYQIVTDDRALRRERERKGFRLPEAPFVVGVLREIKSKKEYNV